MPAVPRSTARPSSGISPGAASPPAIIPLLPPSPRPAGTSVVSRNAHVVFRQLVDYDPNKHDVDDDGLGLYGPTAAPIETTAIPLPTTNSETWTNGDVHIWNISGKTDPLSPDTDGDVLSDGLELGWATAVDDTNVNTDTNGDGVKNFQPDLDPPIYNTTDNGSRRRAATNTSARGLTI